MKKLMIIACSAFFMGAASIANAQVQDQDSQTPSTQYQEGVESSEIPQDTLQQGDDLNQDAVTPDANAPEQTAPDATTPLPQDDQSATPDGTVAPEEQSSDFSNDSEPIRNEEETNVENSEGSGEQ